MSPAKFSLPAAETSLAKGVVAIAKTPPQRSVPDADLYAVVGRQPRFCLSKKYMFFAPHILFCQTNQPKDFHQIRAPHEVSPDNFCQ
jgi:hypothetical protein